MAYNVSIESPVRKYQAIAVCLALKVRVQSGLSVNRAYTPANMVRTASLFTGKDYKISKKGMTEAHNDLAKLLGKDPL